MSKSYSNSGLIALAIVALCGTSCNPDAPWTTKDVTVAMEIKTVSAGFIECSFSTNKNAYYLIACDPVKEGYDPMSHQKQFMTMAIDSANAEYIQWRNRLLQEGEFNVASFASHALQYGTLNHFFTGLLPDEDYWVYTFVVDPKTLQPSGKLHLQRVRTKSESIMDVHFDYRVKGAWDYIYPLDKEGHIQTRFPYVSTTRDSAELSMDSTFVDPTTYFVLWALSQFLTPEEVRVLYGVSAFLNDGVSTHLQFEEGHTYFTAISGYDGSFKQLTICRFVWEGSETNLYFTDSLSLIYGLYPNTGE